MSAASAYYKELAEELKAMYDLSRPVTDRIAREMDDAFTAGFEFAALPNPKAEKPAEPAKWEEVALPQHERGAGRTSRLAVPGGWLYFVQADARRSAVTDNVAFVPEPK